MSDIAKAAIENGYKFECKKDGLRQNQDGTIKFTVNIHADDAPLQLYKDAMGQRYMAVIVAIDDNEEPLNRNEVTKPAIPHLPESNPSRLSEGRDTDKPFSTHVVMTCKNPLFHDFLAVEFKKDWDFMGSEIEDEEKTVAIIRHQCGIKSRSEFNDNHEAQEKFSQLKRQFDTWLRYEREAI